MYAYAIGGAGTALQNQMTSFTVPLMTEWKTDLHLSTQYHFQTINWDI